MAGIPLVRSAHRLRPDPRRVLARPYSPGEEVQANGVSRAALLMERILRLPEEDMGTLLSEVMARFAHRHHAFEDLLEKHFELVDFKPAGKLLQRDNLTLAVMESCTGGLLSAAISSTPGCGWTPWAGSLARIGVSVGDQTFIEWTAEFDCAPEVEEELVTDIGQNVFRGGFESLKRHFGG